MNLRIPGISDSLLFNSKDGYLLDIWKLHDNLNPYMAKARGQMGTGEQADGSLLCPWPATRSSAWGGGGLPPGDGRKHVHLGLRWDKAKMNMRGPTARPLPDFVFSFLVNYEDIWAANFFNLPVLIIHHFTWFQLASKEILVLWSLLFSKREACHNHKSVWHIVGIQ